MAGVLDRYAACKRKRQVISSDESDIAPVQIGGPSLPASDGQLTADGSSGDQAIIILCSPELGPIGRMELDWADRSESNKDDPTPTALQVIPPSDLAEEQPSRSEYMRSRLPRPHQLDQVITHNYLVTPPTRHPKWMSSGGVTLRDCDSLTFLTFSFSELTPAFICTIYVITKIIFTFILYIPP